jgi:nicotinate-nucleotide adenylyltransferase
MAFDIKMYKSVLEERLNTKRLIHSLNVADKARELAGQNGYSDLEKAYTAGLLHDICKNDSEQKQLEMVRKSERSVNNVDLITPPLYHAIAGAWYVENKLELRDEELLNAIRYHTEGRANMTLLDKIIFVADIVSDDRDFDDVDYYRSLAHKDLNRAAFEYLRFSVIDVLGKNTCVSVHTINAYNYELLHYIKIK